MTLRPADAPGPVSLFQDRSWWLFCLLVFGLKVFLLACDPLPKLFLGDSGSYLWTALSGWIPPDRSFLYGFIIRWVSLSARSLTSLLLLQTLLGALTAIMLALICRQVFALPPRISYALGLVSAIDPLQLIWERYVMTETISLFLYAAILMLSFYYLAQRRLWQLASLQSLAVLLISFRISYLLVVEASTLLLPIVAFFGPLGATFRESYAGPSRAALAKLGGLHLALSVSLMLILHLSYKQINGWLSGREPAYLYSSGFSILATWAPTLTPGDSPDSRLARIIGRGSEFHLSDIHLRNSQLYSPGYLVDRWKKAEPNLAIDDQVAKQTALHSLLRRPIPILVLGGRTFLGYFDLHQIGQQAKSDLGMQTWPKGITDELASRFRLAPPRPSEARSPTLLQRYFLHARPYYYVVLFSPIVCGVLFFFSREGYVVLLFFHSSIFLATNSLLAVTASVRYLQPMSFLTILIFALLGKQLFDRISLPQVSTTI